MSTPWKTWVLLAAAVVPPVYHPTRLHTLAPSITGPPACRFRSNCYSPAVPSNHDWPTRCRSAPGRFQRDLDCLRPYCQIGTFCNKAGAVAGIRTEQAERPPRPLLQEPGLIDLAFRSRREIRHREHGLYVGSWAPPPQATCARCTSSVPLRASARARIEFDGGTSTVPHGATGGV